MISKTNVLLFTALLLTFPVPGGRSQDKPQTQEPSNVALLNGQWFNGKSFEPRAVYSVAGRFTMKKPARIDRTLDLAGTWVVPPFGEAHNHNLNGIEERDRKAIQKYLAEGVFYVKIQGNFLVSDEMIARLGLNRPDSVDVVMAQGAALTTTGGHPYLLAEMIWLRQGYARGSVEDLNGYRFFTIDSEADLEQKWPRILSQGPDFIKTTLWVSGEHGQRKNNKAFYGQYGLDPRLLPKIVAKAHASRLRVSAHVNDVTDFHLALAAGVDEIVHLPLSGPAPIAIEDARLAAQRSIAVITTCAIVPTFPFIPQSDLPQTLRTQLANLRLLHEHGVPLAIGSDNVGDSSVREVEYLQGLGVFDNLTLLKMWTETTARTIFPQRKIGALSEGYEASFLALEGNPIEDWRNVRRIRLRFKQGVLFEP
jgi:imidazolonepropionase-like amidohydrolase